MLFRKIFTLFIVFLCLSKEGNAFLLYKKNSQNEKKTVFYEEKKDIDENNKQRKSKNYSKIGFEKYAQTNIWRKTYLGIDVNWFLKRIGDNVKQQILYTDFWKRLQNLDIYYGLRFSKHFGVEAGYTHLGNFIAKNGEKHNLDGVYTTIVIYSPVIDLKYTSIEAYISTGGAILFGGMNKGKPEFGGKFGGGLMFSLYSSIALNVGLDYYLPFKSYVNKGFLAVKTGINLYLNI